MRIKKFLFCFTLFYLNDRKILVRIQLRLKIPHKSVIASFDRWIQYIIIWDDLRSKRNDSDISILKKINREIK